MQIIWPYLLIALGLLWLPGPGSSALGGGKMMREAEAGEDRRILWRCTWVGLDLLRGAAGVYLLKELAMIVDPDVPGAGKFPLLMTAAVTGNGILIQTVRVRGRVRLSAPVIYLSGITLVLPGYLPGAFAVAVGWLFAVAGRSFQYLLPAMGLALGAILFALGGLSNLYGLLTLALIAVPGFLMFIFRRPLVLGTAAEH